MLISREKRINEHKKARSVEIFLCYIAYNHVTPKRKPAGYTNAYKCINIIDYGTLHLHFYSICSVSALYDTIVSTIFYSM